LKGSENKLKGVLEHDKLKFLMQGVMVYMQNQTTKTITDALDGATDSELYNETIDGIKATKANLFTANIPNNVDELELLGIMVSAGIIDWSVDTDCAVGELEECTLEMFHKKGSSCTLTGQQEKPHSGRLVIESIPEVYNGGFPAVRLSEPGIILFEDPVPFHRDESAELCLSQVLTIREHDYSAFSAIATVQFKIVSYMLAVEKKAKVADQLISYIKGLLD
jgi:hypothetical protein